MKAVVALPRPSIAGVKSCRILFRGSPVPCARPPRVTRVAGGSLACRPRPAAPSPCPVPGRAHCELRVVLLAPNAMFGDLGTGGIRLAVYLTPPL